MLNYIEFRNKVENKKTSCTELVKEILERIENNKNLNAFITVTSDLALAAAEESDKRFGDGSARKLEGMVLAIKDNISVKDVKLTCGSKILGDYSAVYDATVIERIKAEGGIIIGKTNMDEFAMGSSNETSFYGEVEHPFQADLVPGGSSGGSAVAVSAELCHTALGSDTGGSIRQPAAFCGNFGIKPTYGRVSRYGLVAFASSLDQIGIFASNAQDTALLLDVISGRDNHDSTCSNIEPTDLFSQLEKHERLNFTFGVPDDSLINDCEPAIIEAFRNSVEKLTSLGGVKKLIAFSHPETWIPTYYILATAEASSNLSRFDGVRYGFRADAEKDIIRKTRSEGFGSEVKRRIMLGTYVLSSGYYDAYYKKAQQARRMIRNDYDSIFSEVDFILMPTTPTTAFRRGEKKDDPIAMYLSDFYTTSANLAGIPAISFPVGKDSDGKPIGLQVQANNFNEKLILEIADLLKI